MRIKTTATNIDLDLEEIRVSWDKKARKREAVLVVDLPDSIVLEIEQDGRITIWRNGGKDLTLSTPLKTIVNNATVVGRGHAQTTINPYAPPYQMTYDNS